MSKRLRESSEEKTSKRLRHAPNSSRACEVRESASSDSTLKIGDWIETSWPTTSGAEEWFACRVLGFNQDGTGIVQYEYDDSIELSVNLKTTRFRRCTGKHEDLGLVVKPVMPVETDEFHVMDAVLVRITANRKEFLRPGHIKKVSGDSEPRFRLYSIRYKKDDGYCMKHNVPQRDVFHSLEWVHERQARPAWLQPEESLVPRPSDSGYDSDAMSSLVRDMT